MNHNSKRNTAHELLIIFGLTAILLFIMRIWVLLIPIVAAMLVVALYSLSKRTEKAVPITPPTPPTPHAEPKPDTEQDILRFAFGLIQRHITQDVESLYPSARWQWLTPGAMARVGRGEPISIILSGAGGYRKAAVHIHNLAYIGLRFETASVVNAQFISSADNTALSRAEETVADSPDNPSDTADTNQDDPVNYAYLAFEWVDAHLLDLNRRANEAIGQGQSTLLIPEAELPQRESWPEIAKQLIASDFADAAVQSDGILISLQQ